ncbi:MAG TPA: Dyp-type peroxidase [Thermoplasmata archaeon]|nr:Dyp-type peroxidase [Thermoplasmata archaeon]
MTTAQPGIFAIGTSSQLYLELDRRPGTDSASLVAAVAGLREPRTTMAGVNLVAGFRPELWRELVPDGLPAELGGFNRPIVGPDGYSMPATQHDLVLWFAGGSFDVVFDEARVSIAALARVAGVAGDISGWPYHHDRDLTGFVDGSENPTLTEASDVAIVPDGHPGAGGSVLLMQQWEHDAAAWDGLSVEQQERAIGRTKPASQELDPKPVDSHVARTDQDVFGKIFRRNLPYGSVSVHGTMFVGFCAEQRPLQRMLESMAGVTDGIRDALTRYSRPLTGAYYFVPSAESLRRFAPATAE